jgi:hypothetical protein
VEAEGAVSEVSLVGKVLGASAGCWRLLYVGHSVLAVSDERGCGRHYPWVAISLKTVVDSGAISLSGLSPTEPELNIRSPTIELFKALSFFCVGMGAWVDLTRAMQLGFIPPYFPAVVIHLMLVCIFAICVACCLARFSVALKNRPRP